mmetsp:Transcript_46028/g.133386  ORF Transcript_46028/g.133386 Transcript_46028/m.133386 type:complete len:229 (-) Transcript_46028:87-773(-)
MAASWEMLRLAISVKDYSMAASTLCQELECEEMDLVPLLSGVVAEVISKAETAKACAQARRANKGSAFSRFNKSPNQAGEEESKDDATAQAAEVARRCWKSSVRTLFDNSEQAATSMLADLRNEYTSEEFIRAAKEVNDGWAPKAAGNFQKLNDINTLCLQVGKPVLDRYGFSPDEKGDKEFRSIIQRLSKTSKQVKDMNNNNRRLVFRAFPDLDGQNGDDDDDSDDE